MADSDYQKYLDERFDGLERMIRGHQNYNKLELKQIRQNTEKTNGKVADHEKRLNNLNQQCWEIERIKEDQQKMMNETENIRAFMKITKSSYILVLLTAITLVLRLLGII